MMNSVMLIGRLVKIHDFVLEEENKKAIEITLAIPRNCKNEEGCYDTDFIKVIVKSKVMISTTIEYCKTGDLISVSGRVCRLSDDNEMYILGNKISFLAMDKESVRDDKKY